LLWINLVTDGLPALALATSPLDRDLLRRAPRPVAERVADAGFLFTVAVTGLATALTALAVYGWALGSVSGELARTYAFATLVFSQLFCALGFTSESHPAWSLRTFANLRLVIIVLGSLLLQIILFGTPVAKQFFKISPVSWEASLWLALIALAPLVLLEIAKALRPGEGRRPGACPRDSKTD
jgi:Ca2+-transporting ATPase